MSNQSIKKSQLVITRFAPSPTGYLHLGHAYSAKLAHDFALSHEGKFLLRIEDIDGGRCKPEYEQAIYDDLNWIGLDWQRPVRRQSDHMADYKDALDILQNNNLIYPCFCSRKDIQREIAESGRAPHDLIPNRPESLIYPGTCRNLSTEDQQINIAKGRPFALRLDMVRALELVAGKALIWHDLIAGDQRITGEILSQILGDVVLARKDIPTSYHLSVVVDDHLQQVSHVIRGKDLFTASHLHCLLQHLLGYATPIYLHHDLLVDDKGWRYAKRDQSVTLRHLRAEGRNPGELF